MVLERIVEEVLADTTFLTVGEVASYFFSFSIIISRNNIRANVCGGIEPR